MNSSPIQIFLIAIVVGLWAIYWCFVMEIAPALNYIAEALEKIAKERE